MLEPAMYIGLGAVAVWTHFRFPRLRPGSLLRAILHAAVSFCVFALLPETLHLLIPLAPPAQVPYIVLALLILILAYLFLSWVWLLARVAQDLFGGSPRGGHPVGADGT